MYRVVLASACVTSDVAEAAARDITQEFTRRPWHSNAKCEWDGARLVLQADNDFDSNGLALRDALADGSEITRKIGDVLFRLDGRRGAAPVIFGEREDSVLLGVISLGALGMMLDPMKRELRPLPMILASHKV